LAKYNIDVKKFINKCETCQFNKLGTEKLYIYISLPPDILRASNEKISIVHLS